VIHSREREGISTRERGSPWNHFFAGMRDGGPNRRYIAPAETRARRIGTPDQWSRFGRRWSETVRSEHFSRGGGLKSIRNRRLSGAGEGRGPIISGDPPPARWAGITSAPGGFPRRTPDAFPRLDNPLIASPEEETR